MICFWSAKNVCSHILMWQENKILRDDHRFWFYLHIILGGDSKATHDISNETSDHQIICVNLQKISKKKHTEKRAISMTTWNQFTSFLKLFKFNGRDDRRIAFPSFNPYAKLGPVVNRCPPILDDQVPKCFSDNFRKAFWRPWGSISAIISENII